MSHLCCICQTVGKLGLRGKRDSNGQLFFPDAGADFQTQVVDGRSTPMWGEDYEIAEFGSEDKLRFMVYDKQAWPVQDVILGDAVLSGFVIYFKAPWTG